ncbi:MAG TPA: hypothetical protein VJV78_06470 [Polyangiales bacterium]|nr:hypothetical protein [Polyangiales bacterium]
MSGHLTRAQLEQLLADDLRVPAALRVHAGSCDRCTVRRMALERARARYMSMHPAPEFARVVLERVNAQAPALPKPRRMHYLAPLAGLAVVAAALFLWPEPAAIRTKGGISLEVFAKHGASQRPLADGEALAAGDQLAFAYALDRPRYLLLVGVDTGGEVTRYYASQAPLAPTRRAQLPVGIELDAGKGDERVYALFADTALDEANVREAVRKGLAGGRGVQALEQLSLPPSISAFTVWYRKP